MNTSETKKAEWRGQDAAWFVGLGWMTAEDVRLDEDDIIKEHGEGAILDAYRKGYGKFAETSRD